jgi:hypothetical protein
MAKPIVLIGYDLDDADQPQMDSYVEEFDDISKTLDDYHVFIVDTPEVNYFKVFFEKDQQEIDFEELKKIVEGKLKTKSE